MAADSDLREVPALPDLGRRPYLPSGHPEGAVCPHNAILAGLAQTREPRSRPTRCFCRESTLQPQAAPHCPPGGPHPPFAPGLLRLGLQPGSEGATCAAGLGGAPVGRWHPPARIPQRRAQWPLVLGQGPPSLHLPAYITAQWGGGQGTGVPAADSRTPVRLTSRPSPALDNLPMVVEVEGGGGRGGMGDGGLLPAVLSSCPSAPQRPSSLAQGSVCQFQPLPTYPVLGSPLPPSACPSYSHCPKDCSLPGGSCVQGQKAVPTSGSLFGVPMSPPSTTGVVISWLSEKWGKYSNLAGWGSESGKRGPGVTARSR